MMPALISLPSLPNLTAAKPTVVPTVSFDAIFHGVTPSPVSSEMPIPVSVAMPGPMQMAVPMSVPVPVPESNPTVPAIAARIDKTVDQRKFATPITQPQAQLPPARDDFSRFIVPAADEEAMVEPLSPKAVENTSAAEAVIAAQAIAVAVQLTPTPAKPSMQRELPQKVDGSARSAKPVVPVGVVKKPTPERPIATNFTVGLPRPIADALPVEVPTPEVETVAPNEPISAPNHRPIAEPFTLNAPAISAPAIAAPQIFQELNLARDLAWIANLAQEIVAATNDRETLSFRLMPRSMGQLDVDLSRSPDGLRLEMTATTERAQQIIAAEQPRLIEELRQSGVKTVGTDLAWGQQSGSQRGHHSPCSDLPYTAFEAQIQPDKPGSRPDGRFA